MFSIAVLVSGTGSNFTALAKAVADGTIPNSEILCVVSDRPAKALETAEAMGIPTYQLDRKDPQLGEQLRRILRSLGGVDLVVLAGFLSILQGEILREYKDRIINIHPSLIPAFSGEGMYGMKVHQAVIDHGVKFSGCTVHLVDDGTDTGAIILQNLVAVEDDSPATLQKKVLAEEHKALVLAVKAFAEGRVIIKGRNVTIAET